MKLENQVCSLELAKRLKEFGVKQESYFDWYSVKGDREKDCYVSDDDAGYGFKVCSAFTVAELGEMLYRIKNGFRIDTMNWSGRIRVFLNHYAEPGHEEFADNEADARAKMLIYLIENKLVTP